MKFLYWLEDSFIGVWVAQSWGYPLVLSAHAVGMSIVVGTVLMINLRLLGFSATLPFTIFRDLNRVAWLGVSLNVLSGLALFSGSPVKFFFHPVFWKKYLSLCLAEYRSGGVCGVVEKHRSILMFWKAVLRLKLLLLFQYCSGLLRLWLVV